MEDHFEEDRTEFTSESGDEMIMTPAQMLVHNLVSQLVVTGYASTEAFEIAFDVYVRASSKDYFDMGCRAATARMQNELDGTEHPAS